MQSKGDTVRKYEYNNKQNVKQTLGMGEITPLFGRRYYPGDTIKHLSFETLTRMATPMFPTMDTPNISVYAFGVPDRILTGLNNNTYDKNLYLEGKQYELYMNNNTIKAMHAKNEFRGTDLQTTPDPINEKAGDSHLDGGLFKKFGIEGMFALDGTNISTSNPMYNRPERLKLNAILAYHQIYDSYFRNKEIEESYLPHLVPGMSGTQTAPYTKKPGYNLGYAEAMNGKNIAYSNDLAFLNFIALAPQQNELLNENRFTKLDYGAPITGFEQMIKQHSKLISQNRVIAGQDSSGTSKDIFLRVGNANNKALTDAMLLGYHKGNQSIHQVTNTAGINVKGEQSQADNGFVGDTGAQSYVQQGATLVQDFTAVEHGTLMVVAVPNYETTYTRYYNFYEGDATSGEFEPGLEEEPDVEFLAKQFGVNNANKLGYLKNGNYLRKTENKVLGEFRDSYNQGIYSEETPLNPSNNSLDVLALKTDKAVFENTMTTSIDPFFMEIEFTTSELRSIKPYAAALEALTEPLGE